MLRRSQNAIDLSMLNGGERHTNNRSSICFEMLPNRKLRLSTTPVASKDILNWDHIPSYIDFSIENRLLARLAYVNLINIGHVIPKRDCLLLYVAHATTCKTV